MVDEWRGTVTVADGADKVTVSWAGEPGCGGDKDA